MQPSEVRSHVLHDHEGIRDMLVGVEDLARRVIDGDETGVEELRESGRTLLETLERHMGWEDLHLAPALREADAWGQERAERLAADHLEQREVLRHTVAALADAGRPALVQAHTLLDFVRLLREDMVDEEQTLLDPRVLRDDVVGIDVEAG